MANVFVTRLSVFVQVDVFMSGSDIVGLEFFWNDSSLAQMGDLTGGVNDSLRTSDATDPMDRTNSFLLYLEMFIDDTSNNYVGIKAHFGSWCHLSNSTTTSENALDVLCDCLGPHAPCFIETAVFADVAGQFYQDRLGIGLNHTFSLSRSLW